jgi:hypothetical protein
MALVIVLWVGFSVIGCVALLRAAARRKAGATKPASSDAQVYTVNSQTEEEPAFIRQPVKEPALSSNSIA